MSIRTYDPKEVVFSFAGITATGINDGDFIEAERNEETFKLIIGADGEAARSKSNNKSGAVTLTLMQSSPTNDLYSAIQAADELRGEGVGPLLIKDNNGTSVVAAADAFIVAPTAQKYGKELGTREWKFACVSMDIFTGGVLKP